MLYGSFKNPKNIWLNFRISFNSLTSELMKIPSFFN